MNFRSFRASDVAFGGKSEQELHRQFLKKYIYKKGLLNTCVHKPWSTLTTELPFLLHKVETTWLAWSKVACTFPKHNIKKHKHQFKPPHYTSNTFYWHHMTDWKFHHCIIPFLYKQTLYTLRLGVKKLIKLTYQCIGFTSFTQMIIIIIMYS